MKKIAPRISDRSWQWMSETFNTTNAGAEYLLDALPILYQRTMKNLEGRFDTNELKLMIDVMNGTILTPKIAGQHIQANVEDGISLDGLDEKWSIDKNALIAKLNGLTVFETVCLELWIQSFWKQVGENANTDLEKFTSAIT